MDSAVVGILLYSGASFAQTTVTGVVKSEGDLQTIPGVTVMVEGTQRGFSTDLDRKV
jgi:hypothetical protein